MDAYRSIIITGGGGMLAHALVDTLKARGLSATPIRRAECDISNPDDVSQLFQKHRPTLLLNCAAYTAVDASEDEPQVANAINGEGPGHLARLAREFHTRLVHYSTDFVFDGQSDRPYRPEDPTRPLSVYGSSKLLGEQRIAEANPPGWLVIRTSWLFGRHGSCFPEVMLKLAHAKRPLRVVCDQQGCPTSTVDLADATLRLIDAQAQGVFHVTNSGITNWHDFAAAALSEFGVQADLAPVTTADWIRIRPKQAKRPAFSALDSGRYASATGQILRPWIEALRAYRESCGA